MIYIFIFLKTVNKNRGGNGRYEIHARKDKNHAINELSHISPNTEL